MNHQNQRRTARITGFWYLLLALSGMLGFLWLQPQVFIANDPKATLEKITMPGSVAHLRLLMELLVVVSQAMAAVWFYRLFVSLDKARATALVLWGTVNAVVILVSAIAMYTVIEMAGNSNMAIAEKLPLVQFLIRISANAWTLGGLFFGLWLLPMGTIVIRSRCMPIALGWVLVAGGAGYLLQTFAIAAGLSSSYLGLLVMPATIGELWMVGYLLIYGLRPAPAQN